MNKLFTSKRERFDSGAVRVIFHIKYQFCAQKFIFLHRYSLAIITNVKFISNLFLTYIT